MVAAVLSLAGFFVALYLSLWKAGIMGVLPCGEGSCETVQTSRYAYLAGVPVAVYGVVGYFALLVAALIGLQPRFVGKRRPTWWLVGFSSAGVLFTGYLSYLEAFVINAWCRWCLISAAIIVGVLLVSLAGLRERLPAA